MTQEEKELLLKELSARLCYGIICAIGLKPHKLKGINKHKKLWWFEFDGFRCLDGVKPYLRPMSSMTDEERKDFYHNRIQYDGDMFASESGDIDWLNAHHFDYRGLINKGLAIVAPDGMYKL